MKETKLTEEKIEQLVDEQTVFGLAVLMMDVHTGMLLRDKNLVANACMKVGVILRNNPGFSERFKKAQQAIIDTLKKQGPPLPGSTPLPTDVALAQVEPKLHALTNEEEHA